MICKAILNKIIPEFESDFDCRVIKEQIAQYLFNIIFHLFWILDIYAYKDGNNIPLI